MRCVISYKYSGAEQKRLTQLLNSVAKALDQYGHDYYCVLFNRQDIIKEAGRYSESIMLKRAMSEIDNCDYLLVVYDQQEKSAGMLMEIGYALAKNKPVYILVNEGVDPGYVKDMAELSNCYSNISDITKIIKTEQFVTKFTVHTH